MMKAKRSLAAEAGKATGKTIVKSFKYVFGKIKEKTKSKKKDSDTTNQ